MTSAQTTMRKIPAEYRAFYVHQNGAWVLDVEGGLDTDMDPFGKNPFKRALPPTLFRF